MARNYYKEIDDALARYERGGYRAHTMRWIADRIEWCARFHKITDAQTGELCERATAVMPSVEYADLMRA